MLRDDWGSILKQAAHFLFILWIFLMCRNVYQATLENDSKLNAEHFLHIRKREGKMTFCIIRLWAAQ